jgi:hypothetical protein
MRTQRDPQGTWVEKLWETAVGKMGRKKGDF